MSLFVSNNTAGSTSVPKSTASCCPVAKRLNLELGLSLLRLRRIRCVDTYKTLSTGRRRQRACSRGYQWRRARRTRRTVRGSRLNRSTRSSTATVPGLHHCAWGNTASNGEPCGGPNPVPPDINRSDWQRGERWPVQRSTPIAVDLRSGRPNGFSYGRGCRSS